MSRPCSAGSAALLLALAGSAAAQSAPAARPSQRGTVQVRSFYSAALGARKRFLVYLPPSYPRRGTRYPVVYLLHGRTGNEAEWLAKGDLDAVADSVFAAGPPPLILVMPDGDNSFWVNWEASPGVAACAGDSLLAEAPSSFCVPVSRYGDYVARDLVAQVDSAFRTLADRAHRGVAGLSMGGTGALTLALTYPDVFSAVAALSSVAAPFYLGPRPYQAPAGQARSLGDLEEAMGRPLGPFTRARWGPDTAAWWRHDPERAARRLRDSGRGLPAIWLEVGTGDPYLDENRAFAAALRELHVAHQYLEREGGHQWSYWRAHLGETLRWFQHRLAGDGR